MASIDAMTGKAEKAADQFRIVEFAVKRVRQALQAMQLGADHTVVEEMVTAETMAAEVMIKLKQRAEGADPGPRLYQLES